MSSSGFILCLTVLTVARYMVHASRQPNFTPTSWHRQSERRLSSIPAGIDALVCVPTQRCCAGPLPRTPTAPISSRTREKTVEAVDGLVLKALNGTSIPQIHDMQRLTRTTAKEATASAQSTNAAARASTCDRTPSTAVLATTHACQPNPAAPKEPVSLRQRNASPGYPTQLLKATLNRTGKSTPAPIVERVTTKATTKTARAKSSSSRPRTKAIVLSSSLR